MLRVDPPCWAPARALVPPRGPLRHTRVEICIHMHEPSGWLDQFCRVLHLGACTTCWEKPTTQRHAWTVAFHPVKPNRVPSAITRNPKPGQRRPYPRASQLQVQSVLHVAQFQSSDPQRSQVKRALRSRPLSRRPSLFVFERSRLGPATSAKPSD